MRNLCFTVDLDRDVNDAEEGSSAAISLDRGQGNIPRFSSSAKGTELLLDLMDDLGMKCTFFAEATALKETGVGRTISGHEVGFHGLNHEDFTGARTNVFFDYGEMRSIVEKSLSIVRDEVGKSPRGFRSPYMDPNETMLEFLPEYGIRYDSSRYAYVTENMDVNTSVELVEVPVQKDTDASGKSITAYLWPMHEGKRGYADYIPMADKIKSGPLVIATHSWHMVETRSSGVMDRDWINRNYDNVRNLLSSLLDMGFSPSTVEEIAGRKESVWSRVRNL